jgi:hypothetical protein
MNVRGLMNFVLLKPVGNSARRKIVAGSRKKFVVQSNNGVAEPIAFLLRHGHNVSTNSISEGHKLLLRELLTPTAELTAKYRHA